MGEFMAYTRFAVYFVPPAGPLADFGAAWLGWDVALGQSVEQPDVAGLDGVTQRPRKYGLHGTLKPPFQLAEGCDLEELTRAVMELSERCAPARIDALELATLGTFLALTPVGDQTGLAAIAATCVKELDRFRAQASDADLERRRKAGLTTRQEQMLAQWGYPYVMDQFRFHLTLTGPLAMSDVAHWFLVAQTQLPALPRPFPITEIALVAERSADGRFEVLHRFPLKG